MKSTNPKLAEAIKTANRHFKVGSDKGSTLPKYRRMIGELVPGYNDLPEDVQIRIITNSRKATSNAKHRQPKSSKGHQRGATVAADLFMPTSSCIIPLEELKVDEAYQRWIEPDHASLRRVVENNDFDRKAIGALTVGHRKDGSYYVVDGQRRLYMMKLAGITEAVCAVFESSGREEEARIFVTINKKRKALQAWSLFHAALRGGDVESVAINATLEQYGLRIPSKCERSFPNIRAVSHLRKAYRAGVLSKACAVLAAFNQVKDVAKKNTVVQSYYVGAVTELLIGVQKAVKNGQGPECDLNRLANTLLRNMDHLTATTPAVGMSGAGRYVYMAATLLNFYNRRLKESNHIHMVRDDD